MKHLLIGLWLLITLTANAQSGGGFNHMTPIRPYHLEITLHKTTLLIFPSAIQSADRGDQYIMAEKVKGTDNILKVKAAIKDFAQSNLSVVTRDGKVYSFLVDYQDNPPYQAIDLTKQQQREQQVQIPVKFSGQALNSKQLSDDAMTTLRQKPFLHGVKEHRYQMKLKLQGVYIRDDVLFFRLSLKNHTPIPYKMDFMRFYIRDRKEAKRTAVQEKEIRPRMVKILPEPRNKEDKTIIVAFKKFTIAEEKNLVLEVTEKGGDRNLEIQLPGRKLLQAKVMSPSGKINSHGS